MDMKNQDGAPATKGDIKALLSIVATKADLKSFATKEDLKSFATKEDLKSFATKEDLKQLATKSDLKIVEQKVDRVRRDLSLEIVKTHGQIDQLRDDLERKIDAKASEQSSQIDGLMSNVGKIERAQIIADWRVREIEKRVSGIESRPS